MKDLYGRGYSLEAMLFGIEVGVATITVDLIAHFLSCVALTMSFHFIYVSSRSGDTVTLAWHALSTFAANLMDSLCIEVRLFHKLDYLAFGFQMKYEICAHDSH